MKRDFSTMNTDDVLNTIERATSKATTARPGKTGAFSVSIPLELIDYIDTMSPLVSKSRSGFIVDLIRQHMSDPHNMELYKAAKRLKNKV